MTIKLSEHENVVIARAKHFENILCEYFGAKKGTMLGDKIELASSKIPDELTKKTKKFNRYRGGFVHDGNIKEIPANMLQEFIDLVNDIEKGFEEATSGKYKANYLSEQFFAEKPPEKIIEYKDKLVEVVKIKPVPVPVNASTALIICKIGGWTSIISLLCGIIFGFRHSVEGSKTISRGIWPIKWDEVVTTKTMVWSWTLCFLILSMVILIIGMLIYWYDENYKK